VARAQNPHVIIAPIRAAKVDQAYRIIPFFARVAHVVFVAAHVTYLAVRELIGTILYLASGIRDSAGAVAVNRMEILVSPYVHLPTCALLVAPRSDVLLSRRPEVSNE
jgi:hypothetical protein